MMSNHMRAVDNVIERQFRLTLLAEGGNLRDELLARCPAGTESLFRKDRYILEGIKSLATGDARHLENVIAFLQRLSGLIM
jgi:hypothetical protein